MKSMVAYRAMASFTHHIYKGVVAFDKLFMYFALLCCAWNYWTVTGSTWTEAKRAMDDASNFQVGFMRMADALKEHKPSIPTRVALVAVGTVTFMFLAPSLFLHPVRYVLIKIEFLFVNLATRAFNAEYARHQGKKP